MAVKKVVSVCAPERGGRAALYGRGGHIVRQYWQQMLDGLAIAFGRVLLGFFGLGGDWLTVLLTVESGWRGGPMIGLGLGSGLRLAIAFGIWRALLDVRRENP